MYLGSYPTRNAAQEALDTYIKEGRPELFNATLAEFLRQWIDEAIDGRLFPISVVKFRNSIFYEGLIYCQISKDGLTPHCTRLTFASLSAAAGMRPENLQKIIGHADYSTTAEIYIHQDLETLLREMEKIKK